MFILILLDEDEIVVDMLANHVLLIQLHILAKMSQILQLYDQSGVCLGQDQLHKPVRLYDIC